ncbi:MAG: ExbD/TolR family protein [Planctomycetaceae bacterium]
MRIPSSYAHARTDRDNEVMTPMIDVVFLLLIFFVCAAAGQVRESVLPTEMTAAGNVEHTDPVERDPWIVEVWLALHTEESGQTVVDMNGRRFPEVAALSEPLRTLAELTPENPVILDIAPQVPMRDVIAAYDLCRAAGFESVNFAAKAADLGH